MSQPLVSSLFLLFNTVSKCVYLVISVLIPCLTPLQHLYTTHGYHTIGYFGHVIVMSNMKGRNIEMVNENLHLQSLQPGQPAASCRQSPAQVTVKGPSSLPEAAVLRGRVRFGPDVKTNTLTYTYTHRQRFNVAGTDNTCLRAVDYGSGQQK